RPELQEIVVLTSKIRTRLGMILTSKGDHLFSSFGIIPIRIGKWSKIAQEKIMIARRLIEQ
ncbi:MAG: hypothetical protein ACI892_000361, partial [Marinobacter maritimus]